MSNIFKINGDAIKVPSYNGSPAELSAGLIWFDTSDNQFKRYDGTTTEAIGGEQVVEFLTNTFRIQDDIDPTKEIEFNLAALTTGTTRTITVPDTNIDLADIANLYDLVYDLVGSLNTDILLGEFTGTTIPDDQSVKQVLQLFETMIEDDIILADGTNAMTANLQMGSNKITGLDAGTAATDAVNKAQLDAAIAGLDFQKDVDDLVADANTTAPGTGLPAAALGQRYILESNTGSLHAGWGTIAGVGDSDIVEYDGSDWVVAYDVSVEGDGAIAWSIDDAAFYYYDSAATPDWQPFGGLAGVTAGAALSKTGNTLDVEVDDATIEINADALRVKALGIDNSHLSASADIARSKIADGTPNRLVYNADTTGAMSDLAAITAARALISNAAGLPTHSAVTDTELGYLSGVTSSVQTQLGAKLEAVADDTAPQLGGDLNVAGEVIYDSTGIRFGSSASNFFVEEYIHSSTLTASQSNQALAALQFAHATYEALIIEYKIKEATTNGVRVGQLSIVTNGTAVSITDIFNESEDIGVTWSAAVVGANVEVRYTTDANNKTARMIVKKILA